MQKNEALRFLKEIHIIGYGGIKMTDTYEKWINKRNKNDFAILVQDKKKHIIEILGFFGTQLADNYMEACERLTKEGYIKLDS